MSAFDQREQKVEIQLNINFQSSSGETKETIDTLMQQLKIFLPEMPLKDVAKSELTAEIQTVESQIASPNPKAIILRESLHTIRGILEGVAGNAAYAGLIVGISKLFQP